MYEYEIHQDLKTEERELFHLTCMLYLHYHTSPRFYLSCWFIIIIM